METPLDYNEIMSNRESFNDTIYTTPSEALKILKERQNDKELVRKIEALLDGDIPEPLKDLGLFGISSKQVATPNHDTKWFLELAKDFNFTPVFSEYLDDKFTSNNPFKHSLGVLHVSHGVNKKGEEDFEKITIVDFDRYDGKKIKEVRTLWGESLVDFHKNLFKTLDYDKEYIFYDASSWLARKGGNANSYYLKDMLVYCCHGILFENFLLTGDDKSFVKKVLLPSIEECFRLTGLKPLIVPIPPMDIEEDARWLIYDKNIINNIKLS